MKLSELGEFGLIERITREYQRHFPSGVVGAGDDAAVLPLSLIGGERAGSLLVTTDLMVENRHFRMDSFVPFSLGWKLLAVNISDIAAMGGMPLYAVVTLQLGDGVTVEWVEELYRGIHALAERDRVLIVGGDTSGGGETSLGITLIGRCTGNPILRKGAKIGDVVWVSGELGAARLGFEISEGRDGWTQNYSKREVEKVRKAFLEPEPRLDIARLLSQRRLASSLIDISDGLIQDAGHIASQSGVTIELDLTAIPCLDIFPDKRHALIGGEDYQLLFTAPEAVGHRIMEWNTAGQVPLVTAIGRVLPQRGDCPVTIKTEERAASVPTEKFLESIGLSGETGFRHF